MTPRLDNGPISRFVDTSRKRGRRPVPSSVGADAKAVGSYLREGLRLHGLRVRDLWPTSPTFTLALENPRWDELTSIRNVKWEKGEASRAVTLTRADRLTLEALVRTHEGIHEKLGKTAVPTELKSRRVKNSAEHVLDTDSELISRWLRILNQRRAGVYTRIRLELSRLDAGGYVDGRGVERGVAHSVQRDLFRLIDGHINALERRLRGTGSTWYQEREKFPAFQDDLLNPAIAAMIDPQSIGLLADELAGALYAENVVTERRKQARDAIERSLRKMAPGMAWKAASRLPVKYIRAVDPTADRASTSDALATLASRLFPPTSGLPKHEVTDGG